MNVAGPSLKAVLCGGLLAGTVDIGAASLISGLDPVQIMKIVAGGLLGRGAFRGDGGRRRITTDRKSVV